MFDRPAGVDGARLLAGWKAVPGVVDVVVAEGEVMVVFEVGKEPSRNPSFDPELLSKGSGRTVVVRVRYDGEDLKEFGPDLIEKHASGLYTVSLIGFLPGFAYLTGLDPALVRPRRATPRTRVPANAVAIAGPYTGVYPFASPGGWHLIGTALDFVPFELALGDRVRFVPA